MIHTASSFNLVARVTGQDIPEATRTMSIFANVADHRNPSSIASRLRRRRLSFFTDLLATLPSPVTILDVGGTAAFWKAAAFPADSVNVTLLNLRHEPSEDDGRFTRIIGDACDLGAYADGSIDVVYSNSVIEHVGSFEQQRRMANEIRRVGKRYFVQTPNKHFPIEPHYVFPAYQFLPLAVRAFLHTKFRLGWTPRERNWQAAMEIAGSVRLLTVAEVTRLFPEAALYREYFAGLTKSVIAYHGW
jgi:SAM-dependent methyltransferase